MTRLRTAIILLAVGALLVGGAVLPRLNRRNGAPVQAVAARSLPVVQVAAAENSPMDRTVRLSGTLKSGSEARLSPKSGGRVAAVSVRAGDAVRRGQTLVRLETSDLRRQIEQAEAGAAAARAVWDKAVEGERLKRVEVERRVTDARQGVEQARLQVERAEAGIRLQSRAAQADVQRAQAGLDAARSTLAQAKRGARPEQRRQAEIQVRQAERGVEFARRKLEDVEFLYERGGVPRMKRDEARDGHDRAQDGLAQARAQLALVEAGASAEEIEAAEAQVRSAEAAVSAAKVAANREELDDADVAAARGQLRRAEEGLKAAEASRAELEIARSDIRAARADYDRALAAARLAAQQLSGAEIVSPMDAVVTAVQANVGEMAGPGHPLVTLVGTAGVYLEAAAPSRMLADLAPGRAAAVTVDSLPGRTFPGTIRSVGRIAAGDGRSFPVEIDVSAPAGLLKPGGLARAEVVTTENSGGVTVPLAALRSEGGASVVWVVRERRIRQVPVEVPVQDERRAKVRGDLRAGEPVVVSGGAALAPGDEVDTRDAVAPERLR
jgi:HlyD family secretion protein